MKCGPPFGATHPEVSVAARLAEVGEGPGTLLHPFPGYDGSATPLSAPQAQEAGARHVASGHPEGIGGVARSSSTVLLTTTMSAAVLIVAA